MTGYADGTARAWRGRDQKWHTRGENSRQSVLTEEKVLEILIRPTEGPLRQSNAELAREFGVSKTQVGDIRAGRAWGHLRRRVS